ncbi:carbohydrate ABC transporter permease [Phytohabitans kaempferiae]|uniref:Carbohydrate ABC transporter permease n=1 Tax=Phytohabitans kaempferiae TaxID=1620943 RepID=A0ABV6M1L7_9ACTN
MLAFALTAALGPALWAVISSFKTNDQLLAGAFTPPAPPSMTGYVDAFRQVDLPVNILNTFLYAAPAAVLCPLVALMLAYPCTRLRFPFRRLITVTIASGIAVPAVCLITPEFFLMLRLQLLDTKHGMVIFYAAIMLPLAFVILRAFLVSVPDEVEEAAALDGASYYQILFRIVAPIVAPAMATVSVLVFISVWNDFLWNFLLAPGFDNRNTQVVLASFRGQFNSNIPAMLAGVTVVLIVPVVLFLLTQRRAIAALAGSTAGGEATRRPGPPVPGR